MYFESGERDHCTDFLSVWIPLVPRSLLLPMGHSLGKAVKEMIPLLTWHLVSPFREMATIFPFLIAHSVSSYYVGKGS